MKRQLAVFVAIALVGILGLMPVPTPTVSITSSRHYLSVSTNVALAVNILPADKVTEHSYTSNNSLTIQPSIKDTHISQYTYTTNYGTLTYLNLFDYTGRARRATLEFNITGLPAGATLTSASLQLYYYSYSADPVGKVVWAYKLNRTDWVETGATWNNYTATNPWTTAGGDYVTSNPAGGNTTFPAGYDWMAWNVLAIVQDAYNSSIPAEFLLKYETEGLSSNFSYTYFWSNNYTVAYPYSCPKLIIEYTLPEPIVTNGAGATSITSTTARLNGNLTDDNGVNCTAHIYWGTSDGVTNSSNWTNDENLGVKTNGTFYKDTTNLTQNTIYYYRCYTNNTYGSGWAGSTANLTTLEVNITNAPTSYDFGLMTSSTTATTGLTEFNITNTGDCAVNVSISGTDMTGTLYENYTTGDTFAPYFWGYVWTAVTFTPQTAHKVTAVNLKLGRHLLPGNITASIRATNVTTEFPTGDDLCSGTINGSNIAGEFGAWYEIALGAGCDLNASTKYAIVVRAVDAVYPNTFLWREDIHYQTYTGGNSLDSQDGGATWVHNYTNRCYMFKEYTGVQWTLNDTATPATDVYGLMAGVKSNVTGTIYVPDNYTTIQEAVDNATGGDIIIVRDGIYNENVVISTANLTIQSESGTADCIVSANDVYANTIQISADWVNISGFTVENADGGVGIYLIGVNYCDISSNNISNNYYGIAYGDSSDNNIFVHNIIMGGSYGIYLSGSSNNTFISNNFLDNIFGVWMYGANNNTFYNNCFANIYDFLNDNNVWNTTNTTGPNIIGGPYLGGNYWSDYSGVDTNGDGFGDTPYNITGSSDKDYLPLFSLTTPTPPSWNMYYNIIVKLNSPYNNLCTNLGIGNSTQWGLELLAPTSFSDGYEKSGVVTLTATETT